MAIDINNLPSNSNKEKMEVHRAKPVVTGKVVEKKSLGKKFAEVFLGGDVKDVKEHVIFDILIPGIRDMFFDIINKGAEMLIYPDGRANKKQSGGGGTYISYGNYSRGGSSNATNAVSVRGRSSKDIGDIVIESREEAQMVLDTLIEFIDKFGQATVSDLYDCLNISRSGVFTDQDFGWKNLIGAKVIPVRHGYLLDLPKPIQLD